MAARMKGLKLNPAVLLQKAKDKGYTKVSYRYLI